MFKSGIFTPVDLQQRPGEPEAAGVPLRHEEVGQSGALEPDVPEVQRLDSGSGEGQASVWTGIGGGHRPSVQVNKNISFIFKMA